jgi:hypothetical protein
MRLYLRTTRNRGFAAKQNSTATHIINTINRKCAAIDTEMPAPVAIAT